MNLRILLSTSMVIVEKVLNDPMSGVNCRGIAERVAAYGFASSAHST